MYWFSLKDPHLLGSSPVPFVSVFKIIALRSAGSAGDLSCDVRGSRVTRHVVVIAKTVTKPPTMVHLVLL